MGSRLGTVSLWPGGGGGNRHEGNERDSVGLRGGQALARPCHCVQQAAGATGAPAGSEGQGGAREQRRRDESREAYRGEHRACRAPGSGVCASNGGLGPEH